MKNAGAWVALASLVAGVGCGSKVVPRTDESTLFWDACAEDSECGQGGHCICGRCTSTCELHEDCLREATCLRASEVLDCGGQSLICAPDDVVRSADSEGLDASLTSSAPDASVPSSIVGWFERLQGIL